MVEFTASNYGFISVFSWKLSWIISFQFINIYLQILGAQANIECTDPNIINHLVYISIYYFIRKKKNNRNCARWSYCWPQNKIHHIISYIVSYNISYCYYPNVSSYNVSNYIWNFISPSQYFLLWIITDDITENKFIITIYYYNM